MKETEPGSAPPPRWGSGMGPLWEAGMCWGELVLGRAGVLGSVLLLGQYLGTHPNPQGAEGAFQPSHMLRLNLTSCQ